MTKQKKLKSLKNVYIYSSQGITKNFPGFDSEIRLETVLNERSNYISFGGTKQRRNLYTNIIKSAY